MTPELLAQLRSHAERAYPDESCGVLIEVQGQAVYYPCANAAPSPGTMAPAAFDLVRAEAAGRLLGYCHSHPNALPTPSDTDLAACKRSGLPWWIVQQPGNLWERIDPEGRPYIGRQYVLGVDDCWSLVREWYNREMGFGIQDFERYPEFWQHGFGPHLEETGFARIGENDEVQYGDAMLFRIAAKVATHCGIYLGEGKMLHHFDHSLSRREELNDKWLKRLVMVVRHK